MVAAVQFRDIGVTGINSFYRYSIYVEIKYVNISIAGKKEKEKNFFNNCSTCCDATLVEINIGIIQKFRVGPSF